MKERFFAALERARDFLSQSQQRVDCIRLIFRSRRISNLKERFIFLPPGITLCCPNCGELCQPRGKCELALVPLPTGVQLLTANCKCRKFYQSPKVAEVEEEVREEEVAPEKDPAVA